MGSRRIYAMCEQVLSGDYFLAEWQPSLAEVAQIFQHRLYNFR
jgi:hypothetical protein